MVESIIKQYYTPDIIMSYQALSEEICQHNDSYTAQFLKRELENG